MQKWVPALEVSVSPVSGNSFSCLAASPLSGLQFWTHVVPSLKNAHLSLGTRYLFWKVVCWWFAQDSHPSACNLIVVALQQWGRRNGSEKHHQATGRCCSETNLCPRDWQGNGLRKSKFSCRISALSGSRVGISHQVRLYQKNLQPQRQKCSFILELIIQQL